MTTLLGEIRKREYSPFASPMAERAVLIGSALMRVKTKRNTGSLLDLSGTQLKHKKKNTKHQLSFYKGKLQRQNIEMEMPVISIVEELQGAQLMMWP